MTMRPGWLAKMAVVPLAVVTGATLVAAQAARPHTHRPSASYADLAGGLPVNPLDLVTVPAKPLAPPVSVSAVRPEPATVASAKTATPASYLNASATALIPDVALAAYQRAASVLHAADPKCGLDWALIAAIGRVESDHGQAGGNHLTSAGVATPGVFGPRLTGAGGTTRIADTDAGTYDRDREYDRAVGPMQFIPSTWGLVGADGDNDGRRDPQDINDAALAAGAYLCSGPGDLSTEPGQRTAVLRYNHSQTYVATVLAIAAQYRSGQVVHLPAVVLPADQIPDVKHAEADARHDTKGAHPAGSGKSGSGASGSGSRSGSGSGSTSGSDSGSGSGSGSGSDTGTGSGSGTGSTTPTSPPASDDPVTEPSEDPTTSAPSETTDPTEPADPSESADPTPTGDETDGAAPSDAATSDGSTTDTGSE